jgi:hypothetical protein
MASLFRKATREQAKLRLALIGPAGAGKTYSALSIGTNLVPGGRVALIDTECGSAELYGKTFDFDTMSLSNHSPLSYVEAIEAGAAEGYDVIVVDSLSHAWIGKDGALEQVDKAADRDPRGNSFTAWRSVTPKHNKLVEAMLACKAHLIVTIRAKTEFVQEKNAQTGKTEIRKIGLAPIQRDGLEYEFTCVGDIDLSNTLKISKTRLDGVIMPGDVFEKPGAILAKKIYGWLMDGSRPAAKAVPAPQPPPAPKPVEPSTAVGDAVSDTFTAYLKSINTAPDLAELDRAATGPGKPAKGTPEHASATAAYIERKTKLTAPGTQGAA